MSEITVQALILWGERQLDEAGVYFGHGTDNALDEAAYLLAYILGVEPVFSEQMLQQPVNDEQRKRFQALIQQRIAKRIPAAYLTQQAWFAGLPFYVNENVLVPRSPFAELIRDGFSPWIDINCVHQALDLCTGSGCIGIALAKYFPHLQVDISDISEQALQVANKNIQHHQLAERVHAYQSDLFAGLPDKQYELIVSNPPYVDAQDMASLPDEYRHEPELGLTAGCEGLDIVIPMLQQAANFLRPGGILVVEVGNSEHALQARFPQVPFTWLEFEFGGHGVFMLEQQQLLACQEIFNQANDWE